MRRSDQDLVAFKVFALSKCFAWIYAMGKNTFSLIKMEISFSDFNKAYHNLDNQHKSFRAHQKNGRQGVLAWMF